MGVSRLYCNSPSPEDFEVDFLKRLRLSAVDGFLSGQIGSGKEGRGRIKTALCGFLRENGEFRGGSRPELPLPPRASEPNGAFPLELESAYLATGFFHDC